MDVAAIRSFAVDLGRPLIVTGDTIQFFDEPAETWFREQFKPKAEDLVRYVHKLKSLTAKSAYVAAALPQLMLEAGLFPELVDLALSSSHHSQKEIQLSAADVETQRLQFALRASLRAKRYKDAAKIALKAGGEAAADERQQKLIRENTDVASALIGVDGIQEIVARRTFGGRWMGSHHVYEAAFMSGRAELIADARSRLRMAHDWLNNWINLPKADRQNEEITDSDIAEMAMAHLNIHDVRAAAAQLGQWTPAEVSFRAGRKLARRLVDRARFDDLEALAVVAEKNLFLVLAIMVELRRVQRSLTDRIVKRTFRLLNARRKPLSVESHFGTKNEILEAVVALIEAARRSALYSDEKLGALIARYLPEAPPPGLVSRHDGVRSSIVEGLTLQAALVGKKVELHDFASPELRAKLEDQQRHLHSQEVSDFKFYLGALLPWYKIRVSMISGELQPALIAEAIREAIANSSSAIQHSYRENDRLLDDVAKLWFDIVAQMSEHDAGAVAAFMDWYRTLGRPLYTSTLIELTRVSARHPTLTPFALQFAATAYEHTAAERAEAETKANDFVSIARAVLPAGESDAARYFNDGVKVASKIGDENLARWEAIIGLANRGADPKAPTPELAYKFARCAEITWDYVVRDKHFDWHGTIGALASMCPSSVLAISSRWRDRGFGNTPRVLNLMVKALLHTQAVDPRSLATLVGFRADWDYPGLLNSTLKVCSSQSERDTVSAVVSQFMRLDALSLDTLKKTREVLSAAGARDARLETLIDWCIRRDERRNAKPSEERGVSIENYSPRQRDWNAIFLDGDLTSAEFVSDAYQRFRDGEAPFYSEQFLAEACARVPVGKEPEFIRALSGRVTFSLFDMRDLVKHLPVAWRSRAAVRDAIADALKSVCQRNCLNVSTSRYRQYFSLEKASDLAGVREEDMIEIVLIAVSERTDVADANSLFNLVGLIATTLNPREAMEALDFGLSAFDGVLKPQDGDGTWSGQLLPPSDPETAVAGYIWAGLAAPKAATRWEAAHVVRAVCALGRAEVLEQLIKLAQQEHAAGFADASLRFYGLHGRQWLMMSLARASLDSPAMLIPHHEYLIDTAIGGETHVLIRGAAAAAALSLVAGNHITVASGIEDRLKAVNLSPLAPQVSRQHERHRAGIEDHDQEAANRFNFGTDIGPSWFANLGRHFAISQTSVEGLAATVIRDDWGEPNLVRWEDDARLRRKIFGERENAHSHRSYPQADDLRFYLSYHAMMIVAGKLLSSTPVHRSPDDDEDEFAVWLNRHSLTRPDGKWLSDRRDPQPLIWPDWKDAKDDDEWRWSVAKTDFDRVLGLGDSALTLWGNWTMRDGRREESIQIRSALTSPKNSKALLRALQTTSDPHCYNLPSNEDGREADEPDFRLRGWVNADTIESGVDRLDPWAANISFPGLKSTLFVDASLDLQWNAEDRIGSIEWGGTRVDVAWSEVWGNYEENDEDAELEYGRRLLLSFGTIKEILQKTEMDMIVEVEIERKHRRYRYESYRDDGYYPPYTRIFLIKPDGEIYSL